MCRDGSAGWLGLRGQAPQTDEAGHRHATWLELFLDLIFVYALAAVVARLGNDPTPSPTAVLAVIGLFVVVQWAWMGQVYYDTRFDPDDALHRLLVLVALVGAGAMTLGVDEVPESVLLPVGYLIVRGVLLLLYLRARPTSPMARMVTTVYLIGFGSGWLIWLVSLAAPTDAAPGAVDDRDGDRTGHALGRRCAGSTAGRWTTGTCRNGSASSPSSCWVARWPACSSRCRTTPRRT